VLALSACGWTSNKGKSESRPQGWSDNDRIRWYRGTQGSRLIPRDWLLALEEAGSPTLFMAPEHFARFGYLPDPGDPKKLPIGFAIDTQNDEGLLNTSLRWFEGQGSQEPWVGMNCSACHTNVITLGTKQVTVEGAATLADFQGLTNALHAALKATRDDPAKWARFAARALAIGGAGRDTPQNRQKLRSAFEALFAVIDKQHQFNQTDSVYGYGRLDAVGHIFNQAAINATAPDMDQIPAEPDAPVSYPFIWNAGQQDFVQWNGIAPNRDIRFPSGAVFNIGGLIRNTSEVVGVFGDVKVDAKAGLDGYRSSIRVGNLDNIETQLARLESPRWPAAFGVPDPALVARGNTLFGERCASCHSALEPDQLQTPIAVKMTPIWGAGGVGTDPWMACNSYSYEALTGKLQGVAALPGGGTLPARVPTRQMLVTEIIGVLLGRKAEIAWTAALKSLGFERKIAIDRMETAEVVAPQKPKQERLQQCIADGQKLPFTSDTKLLQYKGRPLNGIWATAPYLHNGSVKSLFELLLPPAQRDGEFWVGNHELDPQHVGFKDVPTRNGSWFRTGLEGNSNAGHDYGNAALTPADRAALVEYMKTL
jgi:hypothetical protein